MKAPLDPHAALPPLSLEDRGRQDFVAALRGHLSSRVMPGNHALYSKVVEPRFEQRHGRKPAHYSEVRSAMEREPFYQFWSALQRCSQERMWDATIDVVERDLERLIAIAPPRRRRGSLRLDTSLEIPDYHRVVDIHLQPGGYHGEFANDDLAAGAIYDLGLDVYSNGAMGCRNEYLGDLLLEYFTKAFPGRKPKKILDMGCAIGNSTLPWARRFRKARVDAIDVAAPQLRYGHLRAESFGVPVHFSQQNAERTDFSSASFDLVVSHIMLHETSARALPKIFAECRRLLKPGGCMLHLEIARGSSVFENFMTNWESWNNNETFGHHLTHIDYVALAEGAGFARGSARCERHVGVRDPQQQLYSEESPWQFISACA